ncbi:MAG: hypothetical protein M1822_007288 [Bathelium mastoideum]|nr:MAG: hypothetical protein M1822_007288 [Bathelium mastoideum]
MPADSGHLEVRDSRTSQVYKIPIKHNAVQATDFQKIKDESNQGLKMYDPGLANTAPLTSDLTYIDGKNGILLFRGHSIEQLWDCDFEEILYLTLWSRLPSQSEKESLRIKLATEMADVPEAAAKAVEAISPDSPPVPMVLSSLAAYLAEKPDKIPATQGGNIYHGDEIEIDAAIIRTVAAWGVSIGLAISHTKGIAFCPASSKLNFFENLFRMMGHVDPTTGQPDPTQLQCFGRFGALSVDHGMTNSTFALLLTSSVLADPISGMMAALAAGYGPLHFGAPESAYKIMKELSKPENVPTLIEKVKRGEQRLFGYGHRSYQVPDPRIKSINLLLEQLNARENPILAVAQEIDRLASQDDYFIKRGIQANADLYGVFFYIAEYVAS